RADGAEVKCKGVLKCSHIKLWLLFHAARVNIGSNRTFQKFKWQSRVIANLQRPHSLSRQQGRPRRKKECVFAIGVTAVWYNSHYQ
ncbi:MAG: hypothetical protein IJG84_26205, partial [Kiritimatiellae bacterium]|nr:hypothetical protein [Kiritimatiellia bacterium]